MLTSGKTALKLYIFSMVNWLLPYDLRFLLMSSGSVINELFQNRGTFCLMVLQEINIFKHFISLKKAFFKLAVRVSVLS